MHYYTFPGNPEYTVTLNKWQLGEFAGDGLFAFTAPKDAKQIEMNPLLPGSPKDEVHYIRSTFSPTTTWCRQMQAGYRIGQRHQ